MDVSINQGTANMGIDSNVYQRQSAKSFSLISVELNHAAVPFKMEDHCGQDNQEIKPGTIKAKELTQRKS